VAITFGSGTVGLKKGHTASFLFIFNSTDFTAGGDYMGPVAFAAVTTNRNGILITVLSNGLEFIQQTSSLTTSCVYHVTLQNNGNADAQIRIDSFYDG
jgi:hypothetical protein